MNERYKDKFLSLVSLAKHNASEGSSFIDNYNCSMAVEGCSHNEKCFIQQPFKNKNRQQKIALVPALSYMFLF